MKMIIVLLAVVLGEVIFSPYNYGQALTGKMQNPSAVPTFVCAGLYWKVKEAGPCTIRYKEVSEGMWRNGLDLVYDQKDEEYRGSIIGLNPEH